MVVHSMDLIKQFVEAGLVPDNCQRMIIDVKYDEVVKVYYECLGDKKMLDIDIPKHLGADVKIIPADKG